MRLETYDRIRARIEAEGFTPATQTRIALFLAASKAVNLPALTLAAAGPARNPAWLALSSQLFRETEALGVLARITEWSPDPFVWAEAQGLAAPLWAAAAEAGFRGFGMGHAGLGLDAMALGHALLARIRLAPIIPESAAQTPFAVALLRIEQENGRLMQTQIRLLKDGYQALPLASRENAVAAKSALVDAAFGRFLDALGAGEPVAARPTT
ncbi:MAG: hypothetical protein ACFCUS_05420 [Rubrimonas sp.]|uniref:hypothetical protein n=1 Tax=Rubrimonas sp. TaxID=2036015 RepID=UPI002FDE07AF